MDQRKKYVEGVAMLRVQEKRGAITHEQYGERLLKLGHECQEFLLSDEKTLCECFGEIKELTGRLMDEEEIAGWMQQNTSDEEN